MQSITAQMKQLNSRIQVNHLGLPEGIYRPDMLPAYPTPPSLANITSQFGIVDVIDNDRAALAPSNVNEPSQGDLFAAEDGVGELVSENDAEVISASTALAVREAEDNYQRALTNYERDLSAAFVQLDYSEGYPTINTMPFWTQFEFESSDAYTLFQCYLSQYKQGVRQVAAVLESPLIAEMPIRPSMDEVASYFHIYCWAFRAKAFDMFFTAHRRKERERRANETEDEHYLMAAKLMSLCDEYLTTNGEELKETLTPKAFVELLKTATTLQRISVGLSANGGGSKEDSQTAGQSAEIIMRSIAEKNTVVNRQDTGENGEITKGYDDKLAEILRSPELTKMAQEIIIRVNN